MLSALGLASSERRRDTTRTVMLAGDGLTADAIAAEVRSLREEIGAGLEGASAEASYDLRYRGQAFELPVAGGERPDPAALAAEFAAEHERRYGYRDDGAEVELVNVHLALVVPGPELEPRATAGGAPERSRRRVRLAGEWHDAEVIRGEPVAGDTAEGPCVFELPETTLALPPGWRAAGRRARDDRGRAEHRVSGLDPVSLQVLVGALRAACEEMGAVLVRSAHSANIKERRDCSTALFDPAGELVMQAEHIPVHLGSMPDAVAAVLGEEHEPGQSWILNDPYRGGTHLPDITLITPVFGDGGLLGFAASRAHHADVGGPTPAGMPADSTRLEQEGVVIAPTPADEETLRELAGQMRNPRQRLADLRAQQAANLTGERRLLELAERLSEPRSWVPGWARSSPTRSGARGRRSRRSPTASTRRPTSSRAGPAAARTSPCGCVRRSAATSWRSTSPAPTSRSRATSTARWR